MKESDIRRREVQERYVELLAADVEERFDPAAFVRVACPLCGADDPVPQFEKGPFPFVLCGSCRTLYASPRPRFEDLNAFYADAPSTAYWVNEFFRPVAEARRELIFAPRARYVAETIPEAAGGSVADVGAGFGLFLEELGKLWADAELVAIEPSSEQAGICAGKGLDVVQAALEEVAEDCGPFDLVCAFELLEHLFDPQECLARAAGLLKPGGHLLLTTLNGEGFDVQLLWDRSRSVIPPAHLNFANPDSMRIALEDAGLEVVEVSTPGVLDWDIVEGAVLEEGFDAGRFFGALAERGTEEAKRGLQEWITGQGLSSHMRALARRSA